MERSPAAGRMPSAIAVVVTVAALAACTPGPATSPGPRPGPAPEVADAPSPQVIVEGLDAPWSIAFHEGAALVSERDTARILEVGDGEAREVGRIDGVRPGGEGGLLGIAVHEGELFAYFTADGENRVERRDLRGETGSLSLGEPSTVIDGIPAAGNHNGGRIAFGPDGMLYVTTGDAGDRASAQDPTALSGKILRLTPEGGVPDDNPVDASPVYTLGHRNPQGIAWDAEGTMYASEFGQNTWDELNVIEAGANYGWPEVEGITGREGFFDPVQQWQPSVASPSGMAITDTAVVVANLRGERLRVVPLDALTTASEWYVGEFGRLRDAVVAPDGSVWVLTNETDGRGEPSEGDDRILRLDLG
ncbi:PQQ-dependent sugar dehydrogenase [Microbacterium sp. 179-I 3D4 NHS]|uniref:PQQ-dependent sugar dehydrogenase n=1 Tax=Microbacterium sp. 179-I 3D4 NHS TaxID=3142381 RepID=UPI0039A2CB44